MGRRRQAIEKVSEELAAEIGSPLRFGIGVHSGVSVVGALGLPDQATIQFLGDTGNVAARLEGLTKEMNCVAIVSAATLDAAGRPAPRLAAGGGRCPRPRSAAAGVPDPSLRGDGGVIMV
jgi:adenylate cyclase